MFLKIKMEDTEGAPFFYNDNDPLNDRDQIAQVMERLAAEHADPIVPKPPIHHTSPGFVHPIHNICVGVNGAFAVAMRGPPETMKKIRDLWINQERVGVYLSRLQYFEAYKGQWSRQKLEMELAQLEIIATVDITLKQPMERLMIKLRKALVKKTKEEDEAVAKAMAAEEKASVPKVEEEEERDFTSIPIAKRKQPAGQVECKTEILPESAPESLRDSEGEWTLHLCAVPRKAARRSPPGWKPLTGLTWSVKPGTVPVICSNESHLVALYSTPDATDSLLLECGTVKQNSANGKWSYSRIWFRRLSIPSDAAANFSAVARLSSGGTLTLAICNVIYIIAIAEPGRALVMHMKPHVMVTALWFCDQSGGLTWGTHCGESFYCNASSLDDMQTLLTPLEEPVLSVQRDAANGGRWMVNTWMSVVGRLAPGAIAFKALPMERPLAIAARGPLVFVLTKYGKLDVYRPGQDDSPLRGLLKVEKRPPMVTQYTYDGLAVVGEKGLAALMPSGQVHYFEWE